MFTPSRVAVLLILVLIVSIASWAKLRFLDDDSHLSQRWRLDDHPRLQDVQSRQGETL